MSLREWLREWRDAAKDLFAKPKPETKPDREKRRTVRHPWGPQKEPPVWPDKQDKKK